MKAMSPDAPVLKQENLFSRMLSKFCTEFRRGVALAAEKYQHGMLPPL